jgi:hypothetical protein
MTEMKGKSGTGRYSSSKRNNEAEAVENRPEEGRDGDEMEGVERRIRVPEERRSPS